MLERRERNKFLQAGQVAASGNWKQSRNGSARKEIAAAVYADEISFPMMGHWREETELEWRKDYAIICL